MGASEPLTVIHGRYRLDALIGEGGMASVWRAWDLTLQRPVAVKLLFARDARDEEVLVNRFLREARIAASVQHRNVIHIVDFGTTDDRQPFMVMELLEGETLAARLRRQKPLPLPEVVQIGNLTLRGLSAVHAAGIIHRDLKPDNVYLKVEGSVIYPKILDFGISRSIEPASGARSALTTRDGVIVGTPEYMSPEQARGVKGLDYRTDLYSLGVVLYEALTGRLPYTSENVGDLIIKIVTGSAPKVHELAPSVPEPISRVIARAMARHPGDRYADATAMQEALLEAATQSLGRRSVRALSDLPPERQARDGHDGRGASDPYAQAHASDAPILRPTAAHAQVALEGQQGIPTRPPEGSVTTPPRHDATENAAAEATARGDDPRPGAVPWHMRSTRPPPNPLQRASPMPIGGLPVSAAPPALAARHVTRALVVRLYAWSGRWGMPLMAAAGICLLGALLLWFAPTERERSPRIVPLPAIPAATSRPVSAPPPPPPLPALPTKITLKLRGVPQTAKITLDGSPTGSEMELQRDEQQHSLVVEAKGMAPWRVSFVPKTDQELTVSLQPQVKVVTQLRNHPTKGKKPNRHAQGALRVPDF